VVSALDAHWMAACISLRLLLCLHARGASARDGGMRDLTALPGNGSIEHRPGCCSGCSPRALIVRPRAHCLPPLLEPV
jgi:hypothetical protein